MNIAQLGQDWIIVDVDSLTYFGSDANLLAFQVPPDFGGYPDEDSEDLIREIIRTGEGKPLMIEP